MAFNGNPFFSDVNASGIGYIDLLDSIGLDCYWPIFTDLPDQPWVSELVTKFDCLTDSALHCATD